MKNGVQLDSIRAVPMEHLEELRDFSGRRAERLFLIWASDCTCDREPANIVRMREEIRLDRSAAHRRARSKGGVNMHQMDHLYRRLVEAHHQLEQLHRRMIAGEDCWDDLFAVDTRALTIRRQLLGLVKRSSTAAVRLLELRGLIPGGDQAA
jgi:hypothetical protein